MTAPSEAELRCTVCSVSLAAAVSPNDVVTVGGTRVRFRRETDFIVCQRCLALYRARDLREGRVVPVTDTELLAEADAVVEDDDS